MATDMDIDMDLDLGPLPDDEPLLQEEVAASVAPSQPVQIDSDIPLAYTDQTLDIQPNKVHIRGLDETTTDDIRTFAKEHFQLADPKKVEWIDDTSANLIYATNELASKALDALTLDPSTPTLAGNPLELRVAKSMASRPESMLQIRMALFSDKKERGAADKSRFYLMHPEHDRRERMRMERDRRGDNGDYKRRRYDDREHRRRKDREEDNTNFDASMYDDDVRATASKPRARSASPGRLSGSEDSRSRFRSRRSPPPRKRDYNATKELFPTKSGLIDDANGASLLSRERDAPPKRELFPAQAAVNKQIARNIKRDLFPHKTGVSNHRRTDAFDAAADDAADRLGKMNSSFDGAKELFPDSNDRSGMNIRGSAGMSIRGGAGLSIKGRGAKEIKELFPESYNENRKKNEGKELFNDVLEGRGGRRRKAEDMFG